MKRIYLFLLISCGLLNCNLHSVPKADDLKTIVFESIDRSVLDRFEQVDSMEWSEFDHPELAYVLYAFDGSCGEIERDVFLSALVSVKQLIGPSICDDLYNALLVRTNPITEEIVIAEELESFISQDYVMRNPALADRTAIVNIIMGNQGEVKFQELTVNGANTASIQAPASLAADYILTLPVDAGAVSQVLTTNGSGVLSWTTAGSGDIVNGGQSGPITIGTNNGTTLNLETNNINRLTIDSSGNTTYTTNYKANVRVGSNQNVTGTETIEFDTVTYDLNSNFNTVTFLYTAPLTGYYFVAVNLAGNYSNNSTRTLSLLRNGSTVIGYSMQTDRRDSEGLTTIIDLTAGDTLGAQLTNGGGTAVALANNTNIVIHFMSR